MSILATIVQQLTVVETFEDALVGSDNTVTFNGLNNSLDIPNDDYPATKYAPGTKALSTGTGTIDLTALPGRGGATVDGTGLKVQAILLHNTGANSMTLTDGASNGYPLFGSGGFTLHAGAKLHYWAPDNTTDVASGDRTIDITGTGSQELDYIVVFG